MKAAEKILFCQLLLFTHTEGRWWSGVKGTDCWCGPSFPCYLDFKHFLLLYTVKITANKHLAKFQKATVFHVFFYFCISEHYLWLSSNSVLHRFPSYYLVLDIQSIIREHSFTRQILFSSAFVFFWAPYTRGLFLLWIAKSSHQKTSVITFPDNSMLQE